MSDAIRTEDHQGPGFWIKELPFLVILALTLGGVAYTSMARRPLVGYWEFMAVFIAVVCIAAGWPHAHDAGRDGISSGRRRCIGAPFSSP